MATIEASIIESLLMIADKEGNDIEFKLNTAQSKLDDELTGRDLVPKARQQGISSYFLARYTIACLGRRNVKAVVISHDVESTQRMLKKVRYYLEHIRGPKPVIENMSRNEITFPKNDSMFYIGTAGQRKFGRGDTITHLHCSEFAYWANAKTLMAGLLQAVPKTGEIAVESTGNGMGDFYNRCMRAAKGQSRWGLHFFPWHTFQEYTLELSPEEEEEILNNLDIDTEEDKLVGDLTPGQLAWRRMKLEEMDYDLGLFKQEYPMTLDECFQTSGNSIFYKVNYVPTAGWEKISHDSWILKGHPNELATYVIGGDVAAGVGKDSSALSVICLDTMEEVGQFINNKIPPDAFADKVATWGKMFNWAYVTIEQNNHGLVTLSDLRHIYPSQLIHKDKLLNSAKRNVLMRLGVKTNQTTKPLMIGALRKALATDLTIHSPILRAELTTFVEKEGGELEAADSCHDDTVIAIACAVRGINRASMMMEAKKPKISIPAKPGMFVMNPITGRMDLNIDAVVEELTQGKGTKFPIAPQHLGAYDAENFVQNRDNLRFLEEDADETEAVH